MVLLGPPSIFQTVTKLELQFIAILQKINYNLQCNRKNNIQIGLQIKKFSFGYWFISETIEARSNLFEKNTGRKFNKKYKEKKTLFKLHIK